MQREFEEIEIEAIPGAMFKGTATFGTDYDEPYVEAIDLAGPGGKLVLTPRSEGIFQTVYRQISDQLLIAYAEEAWALCPRFDPNREWGTRWGRP